MRIRLTHGEDTAKVAELVAVAGLPTAGLAAAWRTWVAVDGDRLLGTASLERHGAAYLLRSVAVRDDRRGQASAPSWSAPPWPRSTRLVRWRCSPRPPPGGSPALASSRSTVPRSTPR